MSLCVSGDFSPEQSLATQGGKRKPRFQGVPLTATSGLPTEDFQKVPQGPVGQLSQGSRWLSRLLLLRLGSHNAISVHQPLQARQDFAILLWVCRGLEATRGRVFTPLPDSSFQLGRSPEAGTLLNAASCPLRSRWSDPSSCPSTCLLGEPLPKAALTEWSGGLGSCRRRLALTLS